MLVWATVPELLKDTKEKKSCHMRLIPPRPYFLNMSNRLKARFGIEERVVKPVECRLVPLLKVAVADFRHFVEIGTAICNLDCSGVYSFQPPRYAVKLNFV
jgi:hypothetical protein